MGSNTTTTPVLTDLGKLEGAQLSALTDLAQPASVGSRAAGSELTPARSLAGPAGVFPALQIKPQWPTEGFLEIHDGGQLFCRYNIRPTVEQVSAATAMFRRPFIYPVIGPDGVPLTGFGKPHDTELGLTDHVSELHAFTCIHEIV